MRITIDNVHDFPAGTVVEFNYGPIYGTERGTVTGYEETAWGTHLIAVTENGQTKTISSFASIGIGAYLVSVPKPSGPNKNSPWYREG